MEMLTYLQNNPWNRKYNENLLKGLDAQGITYHLSSTRNGSYVMVSPEFEAAAQRVVLKTPHF